MTVRVNIIINFFSAASLLFVATACPASEHEFMGVYEGVGAYRSSQMVVSRVQGHIRVLLQGGAPDSGPAVADCEAVVEGVVVDGVLRGELIPFDGEITSLNTKDILQMDTRVLISFGNGIATVKGKFEHCGIYNALSGNYRKKS